MKVYDTRRPFASHPTRLSFSPKHQIISLCAHRLQLSLGLGLLQDRLKLGGLHDIALDLELARHEEALGVGLALRESLEIIVGQGEGDCRRWLLVGCLLLGRPVLV